MEYIDATKLADFQRCPKSFDYKHNQGYREKSDKIDLVFGSLLGGALEVFEKELFRGCAHIEAHTTALTFLLEGARNPDGTNKFGEFVSTWRCAGSEPFKNEKGNPAKCPYSHKGKYYPAPGPDTCSCGSKTEQHELWMPTKNGKDIDKLVELFVGYSDGAITRNLIPEALDNKPLIEYFWETDFDHPMMLSPVILCGNIDAIKSFGKETFVVDYKTTGKPINDTYWQGFSPNVQVDLYNMAARKVLPSLNIKGVAIEAFSTSSKDASASFRIFKATEDQKAEMFTDTAFWIGLLQKCREVSIWPRNRTACFLCPFQQVCSRAPEARQSVLDEKFERGIWNPQTRTTEPVSFSNPVSENENENSQHTEKPDAQKADEAGRVDQAGRPGEGDQPQESAGPLPGDRDLPAVEGLPPDGSELVLGQRAEDKPRFSEGRPGGYAGVDAKGP